MLRVESCVSWLQACIIVENKMGRKLFFRLFLFVHPATGWRMIWFTVTALPVSRACDVLGVFWHYCTQVKLLHKAKWLFWTHPSELFLLHLVGPFKESFRMKCVLGNLLSVGVRGVKPTGAERVTPRGSARETSAPKRSRCTDMKRIARMKQIKWLHFWNSARKAALFMYGKSTGMFSDEDDLMFFFCHSVKFGSHFQNISYIYLFSLLLLLINLLKVMKLFPNKSDFYSPIRPET